MQSRPIAQREWGKSRNDHFSENGQFDRFPIGLLSLNGIVIAIRDHENTRIGDCDCASFQ